MIIGAELAAWLGDPARRRATLDAERALAARFGKAPLFVDLHRELKALEPKTAVKVEAVARRFMARRDEIDAVLVELIAGAAAEPFFEPPFMALGGDVHSGLLLFDEPQMLSIGLGVLPVDVIAAKKVGAVGGRSIGFTGLRTIFQFIKSGGTTMSFWEAEAPGADFRGDVAPPCRKVGERRIEDGDIVVIDGRSETFVIEHLESDAVYLQAVIRVEAGSLVVEYDSDTLGYAGASSVDEAASRTQMMVTLLRMMDRQDGVPVIREALKSPHFFTRWHIMRELLALDADAALPDLQAMAAGDPHPDVREAAARTLDMFFAEADREETPCPA